MCSHSQWNYVPIFSHSQIRWPFQKKSYINQGSTYIYQGSSTPTLEIKESTWRWPTQICQVPSCVLLKSLRETGISEVKFFDTPCRLRSRYGQMSTYSLLTLFPYLSLTCCFPPIKGSMKTRQGIVPTRSL